MLKTGGIIRVRRAFIGYFLHYEGNEVWGGVFDCLDSLASYEHIECGPPSPHEGRSGGAREAAMEQSKRFIFVKRETSSRL